MSLSILMRTAGEPYGYPFLRLGAIVAHRLDAEFVVAIECGKRAPALPHAAMFILTDAGGFPDNIVDQGVSVCTGDYVLRLDDDESISPAMFDWLSAEGYRSSDHWGFSRIHLFRDPQTMIVSPQLWPDHQARLSIKSKAGGLHGQHAGSPWGLGTIAPVPLIHHKFIIRSYAERLAYAQRLDRHRDGDGTGGMRAFSLPEDEYPNLQGADLVAYTDDWVELRARIAGIGDA